MSTGLAVFDTTVQETNAWLKLIEQRLPPCDRGDAYSALRAVLHVLRDHLPQEAVLGLSAQLPMLMRGFFLEGWRPANGASRIRDPEGFLQAVEQKLPDRFPREPKGAVEAVLQVLAEQVDRDEADKIAGHLPAPLRTLWPAPGARR